LGKGGLPDDRDAKLLAVYRGGWGEVTITEGNNAEKKGLPTSTSKGWLDFEPEETGDDYAAGVVGKGKLIRSERPVQEKHIFGRLQAGV